MGRKAFIRKTLFITFLLISISFFLKSNAGTVISCISDTNKINSDTAGQSADSASGLEKFGFRQLFINNSFSSALPYSSQINPQAFGFIQDYLNTHGESLEKMKTWGKPYFSLIDNILSQFGLPHELKYLAVIESSLNSTATSWVGARGPWQFMPYTAREYGLQVNYWLDERTNYFKSTRAAAQYLSALYNDLQDWLLVIAAYNGGPARVYDAIAKSGSRDFWKLQYFLPAESRTHVKKFIATHYIMEGRNNKSAALDNRFPDSVTLAALNSDPSMQLMPLSGKYNSLVIAKNLSMDIAEFNKLNPGFDNRVAGSENGYILRLPKDKMIIFKAKQQAILNESVQLLLNFFGEEGMKSVYPRLSDLPEMKKKPSRAGSDK